MDQQLIEVQFSPRHPNAAKAMANWERKSQYLLREIVKFRTYIDTLTTAQTQKQKIYSEREAREKELEADNAEVLSSAQNEEDGAREAPKASQPAPIAPSHTPAFLLHP
jgi:peptidoglycan hydrolase CwlO-like protein